MPLIYAFDNEYGKNIEIVVADKSIHFIFFSDLTSQLPDEIEYDHPSIEPSLNDAAIKRTQFNIVFLEHIWDRIDDYLIEDGYELIQPEPESCSASIRFNFKDQIDLTVLKLFFAYQDDILASRPEVLQKHFPIEAQVLICETFNDYMNQQQPLSYSVHVPSGSKALKPITKDNLLNVSVAHMDSKIKNPFIAPKKIVPPISRLTSIYNGVTYYAGRVWNGLPFFGQKTKENMPREIELVIQDCSQPHEASTYEIPESDRTPTLR